MQDRGRNFQVRFAVRAALGLFLLLLFFLIFIPLGLISVAFSKLGLTFWQALFILAASLIGSSVNIPLYTRKAPSAHDRPIGARIFMYYRLMGREPSSPQLQVVAVNVGGCIVPVLLSVYFLGQIGVSTGLFACLAVVAVTGYLLARPVPGIGITVPLFMPPLVTVIAVWLFAEPGQQAQTAYIAGTMGTLIGADILHLVSARSSRLLDVWVQSIGGAGTFDGIFITGIIAVLLA